MLGKDLSREVLRFHHYAKFNDTIKFFFIAWKYAFCLKEFWSDLLGSYLVISENTKEFHQKLN